MFYKEVVLSRNLHEGHFHGGRDDDIVTCHLIMKGY